MRAMICGAPAQAAVDDGDLGAVPGPDRVARLELQHAVAAHVLPVGAARHDLSFQPRSSHGSAADLDDAPPPVRRVAQVADGPHFHLDVADVAQLGCHGSPLPPVIPEIAKRLSGTQQQQVSRGPGSRVPRVG
jgi:hypothetical protein